MAAGARGQGGQSWSVVGGEKLVAERRRLEGKTRGWPRRSVRSRHDEGQESEIHPRCLTTTTTFIDMGSYETSPSSVASRR